MPLSDLLATGMTAIFLVHELKVLKRQQLKADLQFETC
jgi:hypothetical protein